jgi:hypothetical protein
MPSAITAIRRYPATLLLAALLFIASFVISTGSFGKVGGGSDDEGSGIGGTGRTGEFGGSGLGGTGAPSPLVTHSELPIESETALSPTSILALGPTIDLQLGTRIPDRVKSEILQELNASIELRAVQLSERTAEAPQATEELLEPRALESIQLVEATEPKARDIAPNQIVDNVSNTAAEVTEPAQETVDLSPLFIEPVARVKNQQLADSTQPEQENAMEAQRLAMPERIQRPDLPPIQRVRPVERISIMPPRAQPMRI